MKDTPTLSAQNLFFSYDGKQSAIQDFSAHFLPGKFYGLLGPNGCGKTTLLDLLAGVQQPASGHVFIGKTPLSRFPKKELAQKITIVPQEFSVGFGYSVEEIIMMGRHPYISRFAKPAVCDWQAVEKAISALDIEKLRYCIAAQLSGGQKQRIIVARALAQECPIMLFDEATASLDIHHTIKICNIARQKVKAGATVIAAMHDLNLAAAFCDEVLFLKQGALLACGKTKKTITAENIAAVFSVESTIVMKEPMRIHFHYEENNVSA